MPSGTTVQHDQRRAEAANSRIRSRRCRTSRRCAAPMPPGPRRASASPPTRSGNRPASTSGRTSFDHGSRVTFSVLNPRHRRWRSSPSARGRSRSIRLASNSSFASCDCGSGTPPAVARAPARRSRSARAVTGVRTTIVCSPLSSLNLRPRCPRPTAAPRGRTRPGTRAAPPSGCRRVEPHVGARDAQQVLDVARPGRVASSFSTWRDSRSRTWARSAPTTRTAIGAVTGRPLMNSFTVMRAAG